LAGEGGAAPGRRQAAASGRKGEAALLLTAKPGGAMSRSLALSVLLVGTFAVLLPDRFAAPQARGQDKKKLEDRKKLEEIERKKAAEEIEKAVPQRAKDFEKESIAAILEKSADKDRRVRDDAMTALYRKLRTGAGAGELKAVLKGTKDKRPQVRALATRVLWKFEKKAGHEVIELQIVPAVLRGLKDKEVEVRRAALSGGSIYGRHSKDVVSAMIPLVKEDDWPKDREGAPQLAVSLLCSPHPNYAKGREVVFAIGKDKKADVRLRGAALRALGTLGQRDPKWAPKVIPILTGSLKDRKEVLSVRSAASVGLRNMREAAKGAVPTIREVLRDPGVKDYLTAQRFKEGLRNLLEVIDPGAKP
jgi:hypothetical protein